MIKMPVFGLPVPRTGGPLWDPNYIAKRRAATAKPADHPVEVTKVIRRKVEPPKIEARKAEPPRVEAPEPEDAADWPTTRQVAHAIINGCRALRGDPEECARGAYWCDGRYYAFLILREMFPKVPNRWLCTVIGRRIARQQDAFLKKLPKVRGILRGWDEAKLRGAIEATRSGELLSPTGYRDLDLT